MLFTHLLLAHLAPDFKRVSNGIQIPVSAGIVRLQVFTPDIVRVRFVARGGSLESRSLAVTANPDPVPFTATMVGREVLLKTSSLKVFVDTSNGRITFKDAKGKVILSEKGGRRLTPNQVAGHATLMSEASFNLQPGEAIYGLGQHQDGLLNYRGSSVHLKQENRIIAVPMMLSSRGYGLLWDNPAITDVDVAPDVDSPMGPDVLLNEDGKPGGLTGRYYEGKNFDNLVFTRTDPKIDFNWTGSPPKGLKHDNYSVRWDGYLKIAKTGEYSLAPGADDGFRLFVDGRMVSEDWNERAFFTKPAKLKLSEGRHKIRLEFFQSIYDSRVRLALRTPSREQVLTWKSESAKSVDYVFFHGPSLEKVIQGYRKLTGSAPMLGRWAFGLWQSRERYKTQDELLEVVRRYREAKIPLDGIIQDWQYWPKDSWGTHKFDPERFPDPAGTLKKLHADGIHTLISVWPKFDVGSANAKELEAAGALFPKIIPYVFPPGKGQWYDPFSPAGRETYWSQISRELASKGWDGWWLDGSEAEFSGNWGEFRDYNTAMGLGMNHFNAYPLMHTKGVYDGWRREHNDRRAIILTRSAYAGQQRNAAISWSGDIASTWDVLAKQIPAGLNFCMSGIPYWNTDTGGFFGGPPTTDPGYADLFTRWFQYSVFCPMLRIHGTDNPKEIWRWQEPARTTLTKFDELRYHLLPYIYSVSWQVTSKGSTMMRGLPMDFNHDPKALDIKDQFMFGPSLMACPVVIPGAKSRSVYLPSGAKWTDFWTGASYQGGRTLESDASGKIPVFVRAGSVLPYGPTVQHSGQKPDSIELRVYPGADGAFTLYDDEGDGYGYEKGQRAIIELSWDDRSRTLSLGPRQGRYPSMPQNRKLRVVLVKPGNGVGIPSSQSFSREVTYTGRKVKLRI